MDLEKLVLLQETCTDIQSRLKSLIEGVAKTENIKVSSYYQVFGTETDRAVDLSEQRRLRSYNEAALKLEINLLKKLAEV